MRRLSRLILRARRRLAWALYQNAEIDGLSHAYQDLMRLFMAARRRNAELREDLDRYKVEADHYRNLTSELDARHATIRSEFQELANKLESI